MSLVFFRSFAYYVSAKRQKRNQFKNRLCVMRLCTGIERHMRVRPHSNAFSNINRWARATEAAHNIRSFFTCWQEKPSHRPRAWKQRQTPCPIVCINVRFVRVTCPPEREMYVGRSDAGIRRLQMLNAVWCPGDISKCPIVLDARKERNLCAQYVRCIAFCLAFNWFTTWFWMLDHIKCTYCDDDDDNRRPNIKSPTYDR